MEKSIQDRNLNLAELIISKSGMSIRPAFYSGRGALREDFEFGGPKLNIIFNELRSVNERYALSFIAFVMRFKNLNATDFLVNFYLFARAGFSLENMTLSESGINLETDDDSQRDIIAIFTTVLFKNNSGRDDTLAIKSWFLGRLPKEIAQSSTVVAYIREIHEQDACRGQR